MSSKSEMGPRCTHGQEKWCRICGTVEPMKFKGEPVVEAVKEEVKPAEEKKPIDYSGFAGYPMPYYSPQQRTLDELSDEVKFLVNLMIDLGVL